MLNSFDFDENSAENFFILKYIKKFDE